MIEIRLTDIEDKFGLSFTGTRYLTTLTKTKMVNFFGLQQEFYEQFERFHFGAAKGVDTYSGRLITDFFPDSERLVVIPADHSKVDWSFDQWATHYISMPEGTTYKDRNQMLVNLAYCMSGFPNHDEEHPDSIRSGTWQTIRATRRSGKPLITCLLASQETVYEAGQVRYSQLVSPPCIKTTT